MTMMVASRGVSPRTRELSVPFVLGAGLLVVALAWIIRKDIDIPSPIILGLGGLGLMGLLVLSLRRPEVPLFVLAAYLPFNRVLVGDFGTEMTGLNLTNILMGLATTGWFLRSAAKREPLFLPTALNAWMGIFVLLGLVSVYRGSQAWSGSSLDTDVLIQMKRWFTPMWLFFLAANLVRDRQTIQRLMVIMSLAVVVIALLAIRDYSYISDLGSEKSRVAGILGQPNTQGAFFSYYMFLMAGAFLTHVKRVRAWLLLPLLAVCFRGIMVTFSRGAYLACAAGVLALCFFRSKRLFVVAATALVVMVLNPWLLPSGVRYRFAQTIETPYADQLEESLESSAAMRIRIWKGGVAMIQDYPLWGAGFGMFRYLAPRYTDIPSRFDAHNTYLLVAGEMGIPALLIFLIILLSVLWHSGRLTSRAKDPMMKALGLGVASGTAALIVSNLFGSRMNSEALISYFWMLAGMVVAAKSLVKRGVLE